MKKFEWSGEELTGKTQHHLCFCERLIFYALIMPIYHLKYEKTLPESVLTKNLFFFSAEEILTVN